MNQNKGIMLAKRRWIIDLHDYRIATKEQRLRKETMAEARLKLIRMGRKDNWGLLYEKKKKTKKKPTRNSVTDSESFLNWFL